MINTNGLESVLGTVIALIVIFLIIVILIYVFSSILLSKLNKLMYGKGTAMAWIPFARIYLLGKLTFNETVGIILLAVNVLTYMLALDYLEIFMELVGMAKIFFWIIALAKYSALNNLEITNNTTTIENISFQQNCKPKDDRSKFCTNCGTEITDDASLFCTNCGERIQ